MMDGSFFNYSTHIAEDRWQRRAFLRHWRAIYADDRRWAPPFHPQLLRALRPGQHPHLERQSPTLLYLDAMRRGSGRTVVAGGYGTPGSIFETPVATVALLRDPRRTDGAAHLGLLHVANDEEVLERLLGVLIESLWQSGHRRLIGPTHLSPRLASGALLDHFDSNPPMDTPYNPPYVPDLLNQTFQPRTDHHLYHGTDLAAASAGAAAAVAAAGLTLTRVDPARLAQDLLFLFAAAYGVDQGGAPVDDVEARFILAWMQPWPTECWLAARGDRPVGFVVLQADLGHALRRAGGGRNPLWRPWLAWRRGRPSTAGRLLCGAVAEAERGAGIGRLLWAHACARAQALGWQRLLAGPVLDDSAAAAFLIRMGATAGQRYVTYGLDL